MQANIIWYQNRVAQAHNSRVLYESDVQTLAMLTAAERLGDTCKNPQCVNIQNGQAMKSSQICTQCKASYCSYCSYMACPTCQVTAWFKL